jgi:serine/threonine-protein kinase
MGVVYRARDPRIDRTVAIKTVSLLGLEPDAEREYRERFVVEARAAGRLSHPRIVTIFDVAEDPYTLTPYIVMEYVSGRSLEEMLCTENGTLPLDTTLQLTQELAEALDYAHAQGIVHPGRQAVKYHRGRRRSSHNCRFRDCQAAECS